MDAKEFVKKVESPPDWAIKSIQAGRLKGMSDINPQWRISILTEYFGFCGIGWKYEIENLWFEDCLTERVVFAQIGLYIKDGDKWSDKIPGIGGSKMMTKETAGIHISDECYKMAITDALSVACKQLGIGGAIYSGSKYIPILETAAKTAEQKERAEYTATLLTACQLAKECKSITDLEKLWKDNPVFQKETEFKKAVNEMKVTLTKEGIS